jgi:hypothetical protein
MTTRSLDRLPASVVMQKRTIVILRLSSLRSDAEQSLVRGQDAGLDKWPYNPGPDVAEVKAWLERITD